MPETITEIKSYDGPRPQGYGHEAGFQVTTTEQTITLAIDNDPSCCEQWGYFLSEDDFSKFIGAELKDIRLVDENLTSRTFDQDASWDDENNVYLDSGEVIFVNIETDRGPLQFVAYNAHNGYYGHEVRVSSKQFEHSTYL